MSHDDYCPSRMGSRCECVLIEAVRADGWEKAAQRVRDLHRTGPISYPDKGYICEECSNTALKEGAFYALTVYPCPTIKALDGEQE